MFLILLIFFNKQALLRNLFFSTCVCTVSKREQCGFGLNKFGRRLEENRRDCVIAQSQKKCMIFLPNELQKEQDDVVESPKTKVFHSDKEYCLVSYIDTILNTCLW